MKVYNIVRNDDGSVRVETKLTAEEMKFMLEFALANLIMMGFIPKSLENDFLEASLADIDKSSLPQA